MIRPAQNQSSIRRILVFPGTQDCTNLGDVAMLQVALERLRHLWPQAQLAVLTHGPDTLLSHCPGLQPVPLRGRNRWLRARSLPGFLFPHIPPAIRSRFPVRRHNLLHSALLLWPTHLPQVRAFANALFTADLFVLTGCGLLADAFAYNAIRLLDTFDAAHTAGIPTALLGQGIGPVSNSALQRRAATVLPRVNRIFLREQLASLPLLQSLGIQNARIRITGDDALELAHRLRSPARGHHLGLNLRLASYSGIDHSLARTVVASASSHAQSRGAQLLGLPILLGSNCSDVQTLRTLLASSSVPASIGDDIHTTGDLARRVAQCRVVVTGSYHAAVFALAQGIPAIAIACSDYYRDKFLGLAGQYRGACLVMKSGDPDFPRRFASSLEQLWDAAESMQAGILACTESQVQAGLDAYAALPACLSEKDASPSPQ